MWKNWDQSFQYSHTEIPSHDRKFGLVLTCILKSKIISVLIIVVINTDFFFLSNYKAEVTHKYQPYANRSICLHMTAGKSNSSTSTIIKRSLRSFTLELSKVVGVDSGSGGIFDTRKVNGSYKWKRERITQARKKRIFSIETGWRRSGSSTSIL